MQANLLINYFLVVWKTARAQNLAESAGIIVMTGADFETKVIFLPQFLLMLCVFHKACVWEECFPI